MDKNIVIVSAVRTPIGSFMGVFSSVSAPELGAAAIKGALKKVNLDPNLVSELIMGQVIQAGTGQAPARQAALLAGLPNAVSCTTINKVCSSGLKAIMMAAQSIACGDAEIVIAGGMESMSLAPHYIHLRKGVKFGSTNFVDALQMDGLTDAYTNEPMGVYADLCAKSYAITREQQDQYAIQSYQRSAFAWENNKFDAEIVPVEVKQKKGPSMFITKDEEFTNVFVDKIPNLNPVFTIDGTVTAANASTINDGAAAVILMTEEKALSLNLQPLVYIKAYADAAQEPKWFTTSPALAMQKALCKANIGIEEVDFFELNEAFAVVPLVNAHLLNIDSSNINVNGGAVSLGHPLGCSGARILVSLIQVLIQKQARIGAAAICNGGGGASAMLIQRVV